MRKIFLAAFASAILAVVGVAPNASADDKNVPSEDATVIRELQPTPEGYWTQEQILAAEANNLNEPTPEYSDRASKQIFKQEDYEVVSYRDIRSPLRPIVIDGIVHSPFVGKLFMVWIDDDGKQVHDGVCTGTVIASNSESLIQTAGHCMWPTVYDDEDNLDQEFMDKLNAATTHVQFIPAYHVDATGEEQHPFGSWDLIAAGGQNCWVDNHNPTCDGAFIKAGPGSIDNPGTVQNSVGGIGLSIGGSSIRGVTPDEPYLPEISMLGYPSDQDEDDDRYPDPNRAYVCNGTTKASEHYRNTIQMPCYEPITGGASGAAFIEHGQSGEMSIATFWGKDKSSIDILQARLNNTETKNLYNEVDEYTKE